MSPRFFGKWRLCMAQSESTQKAKKPAKMNKSNSGHGRGKRRSA